jgi:hypothetical protein
MFKIGQRVRIKMSETLHGGSRGVVVGETNTRLGLLVSVKIDGEDRTEDVLWVFVVAK